MTARIVQNYVLIKANGHMALRGVYRKPIPGIDPSSLGFLNFVFAYDDQRIYGLSADAFAACDEIDYHRAIIDWRYAMIMYDDRSTFDNKTLMRSALQSGRDTSNFDADARAPDQKGF